MRIRVLRNVSAIRGVARSSHSGSVISALNLFMLGYLREAPWLACKAVYWCDGIAGWLFLRLRRIDVRQTRGVEFLRAVLGASSGLSVDILGSCDSSSVRILNNSNITICTHYELMNVAVEKLDLQTFSLAAPVVLITLPSPLQEQLALRLCNEFPSRRQTYVCVGGAMRMLGDSRLDCPVWLRRLGLESMFRLRTDTVRRVIRLGCSVWNALRNTPNLYSCPVEIID
jgi:hypothetical protein